MIVKDEEESLAGVLADAATFCDELVVVDTGSTDASRSIAESAGARVLDFAWIDDFAAARNYAFDACASDWIIWLDADDRVRPVVQDAMRRAKDEVLGDEVDAVFTPYRHHFAPGTDICTYSFNRERLIRRGAALRWEGAVHEVISAPYGRHTFREDLYIERRPSQAKRARVGDRNLRILQRVYADGDRTPRTLFYYATTGASRRRCRSTSSTCRPRTCCGRSTRRCSTWRRAPKRWARRRTRATTPSGRSPSTLHAPRAGSGSAASTTTGRNGRRPSRFSSLPAA
jgi:glycosyltransferase involved in cell wall biosynthesis